VYYRWLLCYVCSDYANVVVKVVAIFGVIYRVPATTPAHNVFYYSAVAHTSTHLCRRRGAGNASTLPKNFNCWKSWQNPSKSGEISENLHKLRENMSKNGAQHLLIWKNWRTNFGEVCVNSGKNHSHLQKVACSCTYVLTPLVILAFRLNSGFKNKCLSRKDKAWLVLLSKHL